MATKAKKKKKLVLLDAHAIIHRAYHALPEFTSSQTNEPTGALYGLTAMLLKAIKDLSPDYIAAAYDLPGPTKRHEAFDEYKAGREKMEDELAVQIERSRDLFAAFNIPVYEKAGFEADDIIGTIVDKTASNKELNVVIVSGDMDTLQLVSGKKVRVYTLRKGIKDTIIYDEKAVKERFGFGPKLLPDYKGLRGDPSDNIPGIPGVGEKTATALITTFGDIDAIYKAVNKDEKAVVKNGLTKRIANLLKDHEDDARFSHALAEIRRDAPIGFSLPKKEWRAGLDTTALLALFRELGFRTLTERAKKTFDIDEHDVHEDDATEEISEREIQEVSIALWLLDSEHTNPSLQDILGYAKTRDFQKARRHILAEVKKQGLNEVYTDIELPLIDVISRMEERGVKIDTAYLKKLSKTYHKDLDALVKKIYKQAGTEFNINSPRQLAEVLYDTLGLSSKAKTATGQRSTRESALDKIKDQHPIVELVLEHRGLQKLLSTYIDNLPALVSPADGRLHTTYIQTGTTTGRLASQNPNLQNIPIRSKRGRAIRNAFIAEKGYTLLDLDYSQVELRISAMLSGDKAMLRIFEEGGDIHTAVAKEVFGSTDKDARRKAKTINFGIHYGMGVNALARAIGASRKEAKQFLDTYFKTFRGLKDHIENTKAFVHKNGYTETMFGRRRYFPGITSHLPYVRSEAERMAINAPIQGTASDMIKLAMHEVDTWIEKDGLRDDVFLVMQIHDELVYEVKKSVLNKSAPKIKEIMESAVPKKRAHHVPLIVDMSAGDNWGTLKKL